MVEVMHNRTIKIVYCYHPDDQAFCDLLEKHMHSLQRRYTLSVWRECLPGEEHQQVLAEQIRSADIILLLVSARFLASDDCDRMVQRSLKEHQERDARVLPVILSPSAWQAGPLGDLQAIPRDGIPLTDWQDLDEALYEITRRMGLVIERLLHPQSPPIALQPLPKLSAGRFSRRALIGWLLSVSVVGIGGVTLWRKWADSPYPLTYTGHKDGVWAVDWSPNGRYLVSAGVDRTVRIWQARSGQDILVDTRHTDKVLTVAWSPGGQTIVSAGSDDVAILWDALTDSNPFTYYGHHTTFIISAGITCLAWSPDGRNLASSSTDSVKSVQIWGVPGQSGDSTFDNALFYPDFPFGEGGYSTWSVAWSPNGQRVAIACEDTTVRIWDLTTNSTAYTYKNHANEVMAVAWSPDGKYLASASLDETVQVWRSATGQRIVTYKGHISGVLCLAWDKTSSYLASGGQDKTVQIWKGATGQHMLTYTGHNDIIHSVRWSPDALYLASASQDKTVQVWNAPVRSSS